MPRGTVFITIGVTADLDERSMATVQHVARRDRLSLPDALGQILGRHPNSLQAGMERAIIAEAHDLAAKGEPPFADAGDFWLIGGTIG